MAILQKIWLVLCVGAAVAFRTAADPVVVNVSGSGPTGWDNGLWSGDGGSAPDAALNGPTGVAVAPDGRFVIADYWNDRLRSTDSSAGIVTLAGSTWPGNQGNGTPLGTPLWGPWGVTAWNSGIAYSDTVNAAVRTISANGATLASTAGLALTDNGGYGPMYAGNAGFSGDGGPASAAQLNWPQGLCSDTSGNLYIADSWNQRIRRVDAATHVIATVAGNGWTDTWGGGRFSGDGGLAVNASLNWPSAVAVDGGGNLYIADTYNQRIRRVDSVSHVITTVAGNGDVGSDGDGGPAVQARLNHPMGLAFGTNGTLFIADTMNHRIRALNGTTISRIAGTGTRGLSGDNGFASLAMFNEPRGLAVTPSGSLLIADTGNNRVRMVIFTGTGVVQGTVRDANTGAALPGSRVICNGLVSTGDANGAYLLTVPAGDTAVTASMPSYGVVQHAFSIAANTVTSYDFLLPSGWLAGRVVDDGGHVVSGATVAAAGLSVTTGTDGTFVMHLPPASLTVSATAVGYAPATPASVTIQGGQTVQVLLTVARTRSVNVPLAYDYDWISWDSNPGDFTTPSNDHAFPAEELPPSNTVYSLATATGYVDFLFPNKADGALNVESVNGQVLPVPPGKYSGLHMLEAAQFGGFTGIATLNYQDGTSTTASLMFSDWAWSYIGASLGANESPAISCTHRHGPGDPNAIPPVGIQHSQMAVDSGRTLVSVTLPADPGGHGTSDAYAFCMSLDAIGGFLPYGDVNGDGAVTPADAVAALSAAAGLTKPDAAAAVRGDIHPRYADGSFGDGRLTLADAIAIARLSVH